MGHVIAIFGTLIALNLGFGYWLSEENKESQPEGVVEVEEVNQEPEAALETPAEPQEQ
ncbi:MAG: hypothetical protein MI808_00590 [Pseudomonadales bacterium]|nr:hypothetical protein [Pseudomonadales bacterium]